jgi:hypothetical protein
VGAGDQTQGLAHARQTNTVPLSYIYPQPLFPPWFYKFCCSVVDSYLVYF